MGERLAGALRGGQSQSMAVVVADPPATLGHWAAPKDAAPHTGMMRHQEKMP